MLCKFFINDLKYSPNIQDQHGSAPLHYAAEGGHLHIVKYMFCCSVEGECYSECLFGLDYSLSLRWGILQCLIVHCVQHNKVVFVSFYLNMMSHTLLNMMSHTLLTFLIYLSLLHPRTLLFCKPYYMRWGYCMTIYGMLVVYYWYCSYAYPMHSLMACVIVKCCILCNI